VSRESLWKALTLQGLGTALITQLQKVLDEPVQ
jgi:hypothetical protein